MLKEIGMTLAICATVLFGIRFVEFAHAAPTTPFLTLLKLSATLTIAPGAGYCSVSTVAGTTTGTCKVVAQCGTSATATTVIDNVGSGC